MSIFFKKLRTLYYIDEKIEIDSNRNLSKYLLTNAHLPFYIRHKYSYLYYKKNKRLFFGNVKFRCRFSFRPRSVLSKLSLSRFGLKQLGGRGLLNGFQKASW